MKAFPHTMSKAARLNELLCFSIYSASNAITRLYRPLLDPLNLTYPQYILMVALWEQDGISLGELGAKVHFDSGTLTPLVKRLEQKGWLQRKPGKDDERKKMIVLTDAGRALEAEAAHITHALMCQVDMDEEKLVQMHSLAVEAEQVMRLVEKKRR